MRALIISCLFLLVIAVSSCNKKLDYTQNITSVSVVAAVINGGNVKLNSNVRDSAKAYNARMFTVLSGSSALKFYPTNNPTTVYFNGSLSSNPNDIYSMFLCGQSPNFENLLVKENVPAIYLDSSVGVRLINLSPNTASVSLTIQSAASTSIFSGVGYKQITDIAKIPLPTVVSTGAATFQVRNSTGAIIATYTLPATVNSNYPAISVAISRFRNITLVLKGLTGATGGDAIGVFPVSLY